MATEGRRRHQNLKTKKIKNKKIEKIKKNISQNQKLKINMDSQALGGP